MLFYVRGRTCRRSFRSAFTILPRTVPAEIADRRSDRIWSRRTVAYTTRAQNTTCTHHHNVWRNTTLRSLINHFRLLCINTGTLRIYIIIKYREKEKRETFLNIIFFCNIFRWILKTLIKVIRVTDNRRNRATTGKDNSRGFIELGNSRRFDLKYGTCIYWLTSSWT